MKKLAVLVPLFCCLIMFPVSANETPEGWPTETKTVMYPSPIDNSTQPAVVFIPKSDKPVPLLVSLHSWGGDYRQKASSRASWCIRNGWALIHPDFRGPNRTPQACGSELAVADIVAAVEYMKTQTKIDPDRIYLLGSSGGGYATLLLAGRYPEIWAAASAWCGITDLRDWHAETGARKMHYASDIEKSCGGPPGTGTDVDEQYRLRSANTWIKRAANVPLDINHGIHDGHTGSVPVTHAIKTFNLLAEPGKRVSAEEMNYFRTERAVPESLRGETENDPLYGKLTVLFRRLSGKARLTIFDGGHSGAEAAALRWLSLQRKGQKPDWSVAAPPKGSATVKTSEIDK